MACPETVKQALEELESVKKIEILPKLDEFLVTFDPSRAETELLMETVNKSGYTARVLS